MQISKSIEALLREGLELLVQLLTWTQISGENEKQRKMMQTGKRTNNTAMTAHDLSFWRAELAPFSSPVLLVLKCRFSDHVTKRNGGSGDENGRIDSEIGRNVFGRMGHRAGAGENTRRCLALFLCLDHPPKSDVTSGKKAG